MYSNIIFILFIVRLVSSQTFSQVYEDANGWQCYDTVTPVANTLYKCVNAYCNTTVNITDAESNCQAQSGTLLQIYRVNDNNAAVSAINSNPNCALNTDYWFGAIGKYGLCYEYQTTQCRADYQYSKWQSGYPTNYDDCAVLVKDSSNNTSWINKPSNNNMYYVCQRLYSSDTECQLTMNSSCINFGDNITLHNVYIEELNISPNISIYQTRFNNFTTIDNTYDGVLLSGCTLSNTVWQHSSFTDAVFNNVSVESCLWVRNSYRNSSFSNTTYTRDYYSDFVYEETLYSNNNYTDCVMKTYTARAISISNCQIFNAFVDNLTHIDVVYDSETTNYITILNSIFTGHQIKNVFNKNVTYKSLTITNTTSFNNVWDNWFHENTSYINSTYIRCNVINSIVSDSQITNCNINDAFVNNSKHIEVIYEYETTYGITILDSHFNRYEIQNVVNKDITYKSVNITNTIDANCLWDNWCHENTSYINSVYIGSTVKNSLIKDSLITDCNINNAYVDNATHSAVVYDNETTNGIAIFNSIFNSHSLKHVWNTLVTYDNVTINKYIVNESQLRNSQFRNTAISNSNYSRVIYKNINANRFTVNDVSYNNVTVKNETIVDYILSYFTSVNGYYENLVTQSSNLTNSAHINHLFANVVRVRANFDHQSVANSSLIFSSYIATNITKTSLTNCTLNNENLTGVTYFNNTLNNTRITNEIVSNISVINSAFNNFLSESNTYTNVSYNLVKFTDHTATANVFCNASMYNYRVKNSHFKNSLFCGINFDDVCVEYSTLTNNSVRDVTLTHVCLNHLSSQIVVIDDVSASYLSLQYVTIINSYLSTCFANYLQFFKLFGPIVSGLFTITQAVVNSIIGFCPNTIFG